MDPSSLIPLAEPIPVHWAWFDILLVLTLTAHLLFMNSMIGSAAIGLYRSLRGDDSVIKEVGKKLPPLLAITINMGVAPLLFLQVNYGHFDYVSSVLMGGWWLAVVAVLLYSYYGFYYYKFKYDAMSRGLALAIFVTSLLGLLYVAFMFSNNMTLMLEPGYWTRYFDGGGVFLNLDDPSIYPRFLHFMLGALAVGGLFTALLGQSRGAAQMVELGMKWFTRCTLLNLVVGAWFLLALPGKIMAAFLGGDAIATGTLVVSLVAAGVMLSAGFRGEPKRTAVWAVITVLLMTTTRHWLRALYIKPWFSIKDIPVTNQYGSFFLFLGFAVVGGAIILYTIRLYFKARQGRA